MAPKNSRAVEQNCRGAGASEEQLLQIHGVSQDVSCLRSFELEPLPLAFDIDQGSIAMFISVSQISVHGLGRSQYQPPARSKMKKLRLVITLTPHTTRLNGQQVLESVQRYARGDKFKASLERQLPHTLQTRCAHTFMRSPAGS
jgi:hypothetical protein